MSGRVKGPLQHVVPSVEVLIVHYMALKCNYNLLRGRGPRKPCILEPGKRTYLELMLRYFIYRSTTWR